MALTAITLNLETASDKESILMEETVDPEETVEVSEASG